MADKRRIKDSLQLLTENLKVEIQLLKEPQWATYGIPSAEMKSLIDQKLEAIKRLQWISRELDK